MNKLAVNTECPFDSWSNAVSIHDAIEISDPNLDLAFEVGSDIELDRIGNSFARSDLLAETSGMSRMGIALCDLVDWLRLN